MLLYQKNIVLCIKSISLLSILALSCYGLTPYYMHSRITTTSHRNKTCIQPNSVLKAKHKSCFLRADTGPCRADIIQWYYDSRDGKCYRFFWGGCQGNGNKFETLEECTEYCHIDIGNLVGRSMRPGLCNLTFDFGTCFGAINRWSFDHLSGSCKKRLYSGCGGNKNNFFSQKDCQDTCLYYKTYKGTTKHPQGQCVTYPFTYFY